MKPKGKLYFYGTDDWAIYARDSEGYGWYVVTEMWPAWEEEHEGADQELNAVAKYMLPYALETQERWNGLDWKPVIDDEGRHARIRMEEY